jgi:hypothetical protein
MRTSALAIAVILVGLADACGAEPAEDPASLDELRREVAELRQTVIDLRERIKQLEYERLPYMRAETVAPAPPEPARPGYLRFPIEVERAMVPLSRPMRRWDW